MRTRRGNTTARWNTRKRETWVFSRLSIRLQSNGVGWGEGTLHDRRHLLYRWSFLMMNNCLDQRRHFHRSMIHRLVFSSFYYWQCRIIDEKKEKKQKRYLPLVSRSSFQDKYSTKRRRRKNTRLKNYSWPFLFSPLLFFFSDRFLNEPDVFDQLELDTKSQPFGPFLDEVNHCLNKHWRWLEEWTNRWMFHRSTDRSKRWSCTSGQTNRWSTDLLSLTCSSAISDLH